MITALSLAKHNISSTILEAKTASDPSFFDDIRTTALNASSKEALETMGIWQELAPHLGPINDIYVADNKAGEMLHFSKEFTKHNQIMGYLIENTIFKKCLYDLVKANNLIPFPRLNWTNNFKGEARGAYIDKLEHAKTRKNCLDHLKMGNGIITVLEGVKYTDIVNKEDGCEVILSSSSPLTLSCKLLIVCDGRNSRAKNLFFSNQIEQDYKQKALTFIVTHEKNHEGTAVEHFMPGGPFAILPLKDGHRSSIVWTLPKEHADVLTRLPIEELTYLVQENFGKFLGKIQITGKIAAFPLKAHAARKYYNKSIALVADTAHIIHPLAGQGLNQGIKDIECLVGLLLGEVSFPRRRESTVISKIPAFAGMTPVAAGMTSDISSSNSDKSQHLGLGHSFDAESILSTYQKLRQADNENMLLITDAINSIFGAKSKALHGARQLGFKAIETIPAFKKLLIKYAMGKR